MTNTEPRCPRCGEFMVEPRKHLNCTSPAVPRWWQGWGLPPETDLQQCQGQLAAVLRENEAMDASLTRLEKQLKAVEAERESFRTQLGEALEKQLELMERMDSALPVLEEALKLVVAQREYPVLADTAEQLLKEARQ